MESTMDSNSCVKAIRFGVVQCRQYDRMIGDHPGVQVGVPITFSWDYHDESSSKEDILTVDQYDIDRQQKHNENANSSDVYNVVKTSIGSVRRLNAKQRKEILLELFQVPLTEINAAEKTVRFRRSRTEIMNNSIQQENEQSNRFHVLLNNRLYSPVPGSSSESPSSFDSFCLLPPSSMPSSPRTSLENKRSGTRNSKKNAGLARSLTVSQMDSIGQQPEQPDKSPQAKQQQRRQLVRKQEQDMSPRRMRILLGWRKLVARRSASQQGPAAA